MDWISVEDENPPMHSPFLACDGNEDIFMMEWTKKGAYSFYGSFSTCCCCSGFCSQEFTHWMPLPEPPQKDRAPMPPEEKNWEEVRQKNIRIQLENLPDFDWEAWNRMVEEKE